MKRLARASAQSALNLTFFAVVATALLTFTYQLTHEQIVRSEEKEKFKLIAQLVPPELFDNDIMQDKLPVPASEELGTENVTTAYRARLKGEPSAVVLESIAPDGYAGKISLVLAVRPDGHLLGVRVVAHKETPGLGDYIELAKSPWIRVFEGQTLAEHEDGYWKVKKDGGHFEHRAGATVTPRAIVKAVNKALHYFERNSEILFATAPAAPERKKK